ncbi:MAG: C40 family peptidase [Bacteroidota bacterium]|nr:C40 family peptidase [Bacteroidota bacterium]
MKEFGICCLSIVPVRKSPADQSEMVTQLLFGDMVIISRSYLGWYYIRQEYDNYEGWIDQKQITLLSERNFKTLVHLPKHVTLDIANILTTNEENYILPIVIGTTLHGLVKHTFYINDAIYSHEGNLYSSEEGSSREKIVENALIYQHAPYLWGGKTPFGIDCSGYTQMVYKISGIRILRDASQQASQGETINMLNEANPGDLAFFDNEEKKITHVGIILTNNRIIHASGKVRIDILDHQGIFNKEKNQYSHNLRIIKNFL